jgi:DNA polymerase III alpha subunit (gram-positive type)
MTTVFFDLETTGLNVKLISITQIAAAVGMEGAGPTFETLVCADQPIEAKASEITGLTDDMLKNAPKIKEGLTRFHAFLSSLTPPVTLVAHNGYSFDYRVLFYEVQRSVPNLSFSQFRLFDTLPHFRASLDHNILKKNARGQSSYTLGDLHVSLVGHVAKEAAHNALNDCHILRRVCEAAKLDVNTLPCWSWADVKTQCGAVKAPPKKRAKKEDTSPDLRKLLDVAKSSHGWSTTAPEAAVPEVVDQPCG